MGRRIGPDFRIAWEDKASFSEEDYRRVQGMLAELRASEGLDWFRLLSRLGSEYPAPGIGVWSEVRH